MQQQAENKAHSEQTQPASFGEWLKRNRKKHDLTQTELARQIGCAGVSIRKLESNQMRPSKQLAELLATALGIPAGERAAFVQYARGRQVEEKQSAARVTSTRPTNNLPLQPTSFIGREREIAEVKRLLATTRLLTLTGAGGTGKTRLSLAVAAELLNDYPDGVWLVELAPLTDPALVVSSIASVLGVQQEQDRLLLPTLLYWLRDKQLLLILDNCEHLIEACAQFADGVLRAGPAARILATSREALGIAGETAYRIPSLSLPPATLDLTGFQNPWGLAARYESMVLFVERATQSLTTFSLTNANTPVVAQICYRLDGIPLAIELAAVRVKVMHVEQIAERLDDRFRLLTGGNRTALPRQQTLRGMIDWSHSLLTESERVLLRRLSIFAGGWTLAAAEAVCGDDDGGRRGMTTDDGRWTTAAGQGLDLSSAVPPRPDGVVYRLPSADVLDLLTHLVEKSLVVPAEQDGETRYRMLETIRQYAREKMLDANESEPLHDRHLAFFLKLAEVAEPMLYHARRIDMVARLERDCENLRVALEWACERDPETALRLAGLLAWFWLFNDHMNEAHVWYQRVLSLGSLGAKTKAMALALYGAGTNAAILGLFDDARVFLEHSIAVWRVLEDRTRQAAALERLSYALMKQGQCEDACAMLETHEALVRDFAEPVARAYMLATWGQALMYSRSDFVAAKALLDESLSTGIRHQDPAATGYTFAALGRWAEQQGEYESARCYHLNQLAWRRRDGTRWGAAFALNGAAEVVHQQGDYAQARRLYAESLALLRGAGLQRYVADVLRHLGLLELHENNPAQAAGYLTESLEIFREQSDSSGMARCLLGFAQLRHTQGQVEVAARLLAVGSLPPAIQGAPFKVDRLAYERSVAAVRKELDDTTFDAAWAAGRKMTLEESIESALRVV